MADVVWTIKAVNQFNTIQQPHRLAVYEIGSELNHSSYRELDNNDNTVIIGLYRLKFRVTDIERMSIEIYAIEVVKGIEVTPGSDSITIPVEMVSKLLYATNPDDFYKPVDHPPSENDNEVIPNEVFGIKVNQEVKLHKAWRIYRKMSIADVAQALGATEQHIKSQEDQVRWLQKESKKRLAKLYDCRTTQFG